MCAHTFSFPNLPAWKTLSEEGQALCFASLNVLPACAMGLHRRPDRYGVGIGREATRSRAAPASYGDKGPGPGP